ncbi:MAG: hypothetical protein UR12_C0006G0006 [candidate division TM6 bacterium GW2011_GWF2_30_66]|nr:MAG: hypothetical protein UR12_C0006G0006 [candidate division TM6 bacterium GW2011_GWF2_30_66]
MNNSFKNNIIAIEALKFGFASFVKNIKFLLLSFAASGLMFIGGFIANILTVQLFFIPIFMVHEKLKETFMRISMINSFSSVMQGAAVDKAAQSAIIWQKFLTEGFVSFPFSAAFAILGIFTFFTILFALITMVSIGWMKISLNIADCRENRLSALFINPKILFKAFCIGLISLMSFIMSLVLILVLFKINIIIGSVYAVIMLPVVIYLSFKFAYSVYFLIDKNTGIYESFKSSFRLKNGFSNILVLVLMALPVSIVISLLRTVVYSSSLVSIRLILGSLGMILQFSLSCTMLVAISKIYRELTMRSEQNR